MQQYGRYGLQKVQGKIEQFNIDQGLFAAQNRAQGIINKAKSDAWKVNAEFLGKAIQNSKFSDLLASGQSGKSINRLGVLEMGAMGRFFAEAKNRIARGIPEYKAGVSHDRTKAAIEKESVFARSAFGPTPDIKPPRMQRQSLWAANLQDMMSVVSMVTSVAGLDFSSDRRLKTDIKQIGESINGHKIYRYKYLDYDKEYIGAMADEVIKIKPEAVYKMDNGYLGVDY